jgi:hypothetical protein
MKDYRVLPPKGAGRLPTKDISNFDTMSTQRQQHPTPPLTSMVSEEIGSRLQQGLPHLSNALTTI